MQARALAEICPEIRDRVPLVTSTPPNPEKRPQILHISEHISGYLVAVYRNIFAVVGLSLHFHNGNTHTGLVFDPKGCSEPPK